MKRSSRAFTLPEALVAFAITVLTLGLLMRAIALGSRGDSRSELTLDAIRLAQSELAAAGLTAPIRPGIERREGVGALRWQIEAEALLPPEGAQEALNAYRVSVEVTTKDNPRLAIVRLTTIKILEPLE
jgi:type II secretory pathway pseudopilin PulG